MTIFTEIKAKQQINFLYGYWKTSKDLYQPTIIKLRKCEKEIVLKLANKQSRRFSQLLAEII